MLCLTNALIPTAASILVHAHNGVSYAADVATTTSLPPKALQAPSRSHTERLSSTVVSTMLHQNIALTMEHNFQLEEVPSPSNDSWFGGAFHVSCLSWPVFTCCLRVIRPVLCSWTLLHNLTLGPSVDLFPPCYIRNIEYNL